MFNDVILFILSLVPAIASASFILFVAFAFCRAFKGGEDNDDKGT